MKKPSDLMINIGINGLSFLNPITGIATAAFTIIKDVFDKIKEQRSWLSLLKKK